MYSKDGKVYSDGYKYLKHKTKPVIGFAVFGSEDEFEEKDVDLDSILIEGDFLTMNGCLRFCIPNKTHKEIKTVIIKSRYSYDDQIAIMLNGDKISLERMQKWREFADDIANRICEEE